MFDNISVLDERRVAKASDPEDSGVASPGGSLLDDDDTLDLLPERHGDEPDRS